MNVILYSTGCPKCKMLEANLRRKNIAYKKINDIDIMTEKGFTIVPMLEVDGEVMDFHAAINWANGN